MGKKKDKIKSSSFSLKMVPLEYLQKFENYIYLWLERGTAVLKICSVTETWLKSMHPNLACRSYVCLCVSGNLIFACQLVIGSSPGLERVHAICMWVWVTLTHRAGPGRACACAVACVQVCPHPLSQVLRVSHSLNWVSDCECSSLLHCA